MGYEYHIAISYAGEDRPVADELATRLRDDFGLKVFLDTFELPAIIGTFFYEEFAEVYTNKSRYCIPIISRHFKEKEFPRFEWKAIQARAAKTPDLVYFIPVKLDDTELPGLNPGIIYLSTRRFSIYKIAALIYKKISAEVEKLKILGVQRTLWHMESSSKQLSY